MTLTARDIEGRVHHETVATLVHYSDHRDRTHQSREGYLGPSDIGFCRNKALLTLKQVEPTDMHDGITMWPADVGSAVHNWVEDAFATNRKVLTGREIGRVTATFRRSGAQLSGTPDLVIPDLNTVIDLKTVNGTGYVRRNGPSLNHRYQRHIYGMGLAAKGILRDDGTMFVGNMYLDRSGNEREPYVTVEAFDPTLTPQIDEWIADVIYARVHEEDASRDIPAERCEAICEFYTACRGGRFEDSHNPTLIDHPDLVAAVDMYVDGQELKKRGEAIMEAAKPALVNVNGATEDGWQVRWTHVEAGRVEGFNRRAYDKVDVRKIRGR